MNPRKRINLDLPKQERWIKIFEEYREELIKIKKPVIDMIDDFLRSDISKNFGKNVLFKTINSYKMINKIMHLEELEQISKISTIDFEYILILQFIYEASSCCTSVITKVNDSMTMYRTMDWPFDFLKNLTIDVDFMKDNKIIFSATTWVGYVGLLTVSVPNNFSLAINYRMTKEITVMEIIKNAFSAIKMNWPIGYLIREIVEKQMNYNDAINSLCKIKLISPCYIIICTNNKTPKVINRCSDSFEIYRNNFIVQTNCDQLKTEPDILYSVKRRTMIENIIAENNNNFRSIEDMVIKFNKYPVINDETIYYSIMSDNNMSHISYNI